MIVVRMVFMVSVVLVILVILVGVIVVPGLLLVLAMTFMACVFLVVPVAVVVMFAVVTVILMRFMLLMVIVALVITMRVVRFLYWGRRCFRLVGMRVLLMPSGVVVVSVSVVMPGTGVGVCSETQRQQDASEKLFLKGVHYFE